jgi:hypothetical protein
VARKGPHGNTFMASATTETGQHRSVLPDLTKIQTAAMPIAGIGLIGLALGFILDQSAGHKNFWSSYYFGYMLAMSLTLGCTTLVFLHNAVRGSWGLAILRILEAGTKMLPIMAVGMIPIVIAVWMGQIYPWADANTRATEAVWHKKELYLNPLWFTIRQVIYFGYWIWATAQLRKSGLKQDESRDENLGLQRGSFAAPFGVIHVVLLTFAYTDWLMSLTEWFSTLYGVWNMTKNILLTLAFSSFIVMKFRDRKPYSDIVTPALARDLGNMMLGFTMFWGYTSLSQFLIIWSGNLPEEVTFYGSRFDGPLVYVGAFLVFGHFFGPFLALITGRTKRTAEILMKVCAWLMFIRVVDTWWDIVPFFGRRLTGPTLGWLVFDLAALAGFGGLWIAVTMANMKKEALYPAHDPRLIEAKELAAHGAH